MKEGGGGQGFILMMWDTNPAMPYLAYSKVQNKDMCPNKHTGWKNSKKQTYWLEYVAIALVYFAFVEKNTHSFDREFTKIKQKFLLC